MYVTSNCIRQYSWFITSVIDISLFPSYTFKSTFSSCYFSLTFLVILRFHVFPLIRRIFEIAGILGSKLHSLYMLECFGYKILFKSVQIIVSNTHFSCNMTKLLVYCIQVNILSSSIIWSRPLLTLTVNRQMATNKKRNDK